MSYVVGIDTGGTYTDSVLLNTEHVSNIFVVKQSKSFTTIENLDIGIKKSIDGLCLSKNEIGKIERVVLSTTLATNAIVENIKYNVGLIIIGEQPHGNLATEHFQIIEGKVNIKGRVVINVNEKAVVDALNILLPCVDAIAVSGLASVRNPVQEQQVRNIIKRYSDIPIVCGHELVDDLGYLDRTNTAIINAGLLPIINDFVDSILCVLTRMNINAPVFLVKGDGNITEINAIKKAPIETVLSGPAASMIGAIHLTNQDNLIVSDMGGTTTDTGLVINKRIALSREGAVIGRWKIKIKSAKLQTFGLGGDSEILVCGDKYLVGPKRVLPACRGGFGNVTPTDILHFTGEFIEWDRVEAVDMINRKASDVGISPQEFAVKSKRAIMDRIFLKNELIQQFPKLPVCAIGAPSEIWYSQASKIYNFNIIIPDNFAVANAVGAAAAGVREEVRLIIRPGEEGYGYILHTKLERKVFTDKKKAISEGFEIAKDFLFCKIREQNLEVGSIEVHCEEIYKGENGLIYKTITIDNEGIINIDEDKITSSNEPRVFHGAHKHGTCCMNNLEKYLETRIIVSATGCMFVDMQ